ncbi:MAG: hypothetical protein U9Q16_02060 [Patescibacteria group bacterium]|nr:hypothetical protein [Patescibacteria group bacterium]
MDKKYIFYAIIPALTFVVLGAGVASANGLFNGFRNLSPEDIAQKQEVMFQEKADFLGVSLDEMKNAWTEGKTIKDIAEEQGISEEEMQARMRQAKEEALQSRMQAMVDNGVISQEQANERLEFMQNRLENKIMGENMKERIGDQMGQGFRKFNKGFK